MSMLAQIAQRDLATELLQRVIRMRGGLVKV